jgi:flagellar protein FlaI
MEDKIIEAYSVMAEKIRADVKIKVTEKDFVPIYDVAMPKLEEATNILLEDIRNKLITIMRISITELMDPSTFEELKGKFYSKSIELLEKQLPGISPEKKQVLAGILMHEMLGLGPLEILIADGNLEEIVVNSSKEPVWVYHKKHGWLKTNIIIPNETQIHDYASSIGRKIGRQITTLDPLLDAHLITGDRVNATLFPISTIGNTITIRLFKRNPWTITDFIENKTVSSEVAALLWLAIQYEMSIIVSGGTASGKTSLLGSIMPFIQTNHRIISIEDTRELNLPSFLHWVPLTTRESNPEGKGEITMLDLLVNSLRMRPDRIIVAEIRRQRQAEVLFEAMHTGHSVYATLHADTAEQTYRRLVNPPINVPETLLEALDLIVAMFRDRRSGRRRIYQIAELIPPIGTKKGLTLRILFKWNPRNDKIERFQSSHRLINKLQMHTGMSIAEIEKDIKDKEKIFNWMLKNHVNTVNGVGKLVAEYYKNPKYVLDLVEKNEKAEKIIPKELLRLKE